MSSIASIGRMVSGLSAAQKGLQVTGHNISNVNTQGYIRQQLLQHESSYLNIGSNGRLMQVGLGVTPTEIRQIRSELADRRFRTENGILGFYQAQNASIQEIEAILDEPYGESISKMLGNLWAQAQKLNTNPDGVEERLSFIQAANVLVKKANHIADSFMTYQDNLNSEVIKSVDRINELIRGVYEHNEKIALSEINGDNANDYRDQRNLLLDELSGFMEIDYYEEADSRIVLKAEGRTVVDKQFVTLLELKQTVDNSPFVKPIWSNTKEDVYNFNKVISAAKENDTGKLKSLLLIRGDEYVRADQLDASGAIVKYGTSWSDIALNDNYSVDVPGNSYFVPKIHKKFNELINELTTMANALFDGDGIGIHEGLKGVPMFVPIKTPADYPYTGAPKPTDPTDPGYQAAYKTYVDEYNAYLKKINSYLVPGNIRINPDLMENGGYNRLGTVDPTYLDQGNNSKVTEFLAGWSTNRDWPKDAQGSTVSDPTRPYAKKVSIMGFYAEFVTDIGLEGSGYKNKVSEKQTTVVNIENERQSIGGVSQDEEFTSMLKYQYAYNASARMITMLDSMMDTIINKM
ncbi:flagellar hook-associated protein FlgK [Cellulosilyticum sp. I15G10I2]|uniref:flagellar hook-associated protein FlgK n=1 Tax=Cellulosilyticum sp. I15G10I2 TaxID=1892843 RepID=UPI00085C59A1|nr:flagellar hook-associated protein FlgK [Cellulosilyticum sp. I15G10I2]